MFRNNSPVQVMAILPHLLALHRLRRKCDSAVSEVAFSLEYSSSRPSALKIYVFVILGNNI